MDTIEIDGQEMGGRHRGVLVGYQGEIIILFHSKLDKE